MVVFFGYETKLWLFYQLEEFFVALCLARRGRVWLRILSSRLWLDRHYHIRRSDCYSELAAAFKQCRGSVRG